MSNHKFYKKMLFLIGANKVKKHVKNHTFCSVFREKQTNRKKNRKSRLTFGMFLLPIGRTSKK